MCGQILLLILLRQGVSQVSRSSIDLTVNNPYEASILNLISCCPVLEDVTIDGVIDIHDILDTSAPQLKTMTISIFEPCEKKIYITAPKLETLILSRLPSQIILY